MSACFSMAHFLNRQNRHFTLIVLHIFFRKSNKNFVVFTSFSYSTFVSRRRLLAPHSLCSRRLLLCYPLDFQSVFNSTALLHSLSRMISQTPNYKISGTVSSFIGTYTSLNKQTLKQRTRIMKR